MSPTNGKAGTGVGATRIGNVYKQAANLDDLDARVLKNVVEAQLERQIDFDEVMLGIRRKYKLTPGDQVDWRTGAITRM